jgi:hypothetical protein
MTDTIKVNVEQEIVDALRREIDLFELFKSASGHNENAFFNTLILNYYREYAAIEQEMAEKAQSILVRQYGKKKVPPVLVSRLARLALLNELTTEKYFNRYVFFKTTYETVFAVSYIEGNLLNGASLSSYFRNMFVHYLRLPYQERERIIYKEQVNAINKAIQEDKQIEVTTVKDSKFVISPFAVAGSRIEGVNYLLGVEDNDTSSNKLMRIKEIRILNQPRTISPEQKEALSRTVSNDPQYLISVDEVSDISLYFTPVAKRQYAAVALGRPEATQVDDNVYHFNCSFKQIIYYFSRFGSEVQVLTPTSLATQFGQFYRRAALRYEKEKNPSPSNENKSN